MKLFLLGHQLKREDVLAPDDADDALLILGDGHDRVIDLLNMLHSHQVLARLADGLDQISNRSRYGDA